MGDLEAASFVAECARAISTKAQCWYRPARVTAITVQRRGDHDLTIWIVTEITYNGHFDPITVSYRAFLRRLPQYTKPIISTEAVARLLGAGVHPCSYWEVPGNVRDLIATAALRSFGYPEIDLFK